MRNKTTTIKWLILFATAIEVYFFYLLLISKIRIEANQLFIRWGHAARMPTAFAIFLFLFFIALTVSTIGLWWHRRWAYLMFNIWSIPSLAIIVFDIILFFFNNSYIMWGEILGLMVGFALLTLLNAKSFRMSAVGHDLKKKEIFVIVGGVLLNVIAFVLVLKLV